MPEINLEEYAASSPLARQAVDRMMAESVAEAATEPRARQGRLARLAALLNVSPTPTQTEVEPPQAETRPVVPEVTAAPKRQNRALQPDRTPETRVTVVENPPVEADEPQRTYVIVGNNRGGATMVAGVAHLLGLDLKFINPGNLEDPEFANGSRGIIATGSTDSAAAQTDQISSLSSVIDSRNSEFDVWGWKDPYADAYLPQIIGELRNPHLIVVWRDPAATATSMMVANDTGADDAFTEVLEQQLRYWRLVHELKVPALMVSYERGRLRPAELAEEMAAFLGMDLTDDLVAQITEYCSPTGRVFGG